MSDADPKPLLFYSRRRRRRSCDAVDLGDSGDRDVRPRSNLDAPAASAGSPDPVVEAPPSGGTPRRPRPSHPRAPSPVPHAPASSTSEPRRGMVPLHRPGAAPTPSSAPSPAPPRAPTPAPSRAPAPAPPRAPAPASPPVPAPAPNPWFTHHLLSGARLQGPPAPASSPSASGPSQPAGPRSSSLPAAPATPIAIIPRPVKAGQPQDNTPRDINMYTGLRLAADLPVSCIHGGAHSRGVDDVRESLVSLLRYMYVQALHKLPMEDMPGLLGCLASAGHAYGILEPLNNILVNAISFYPLRKRYRDQRIDPGIYNPMYWTGAADSSLRGLVTFLRCYFKYLSEKQALGYLYLANADLILAIGLVERDQNVPYTFHNASSTRTHVSLNLAAISAEHPKPAVVTFTATRFLLAASVDRIRMYLRSPKLSKFAILQIPKLLKDSTEKEVKTLYNLRTERYLPFDTVKPKIVKRRDNWNSLDSLDCAYIQMLKLMILDGCIKMFHLEAVSRLSKDAVSRLHRGLAVAGHSCGYFDDPTHNVIINSIWYTLAFAEEGSLGCDTPVSMICTDHMFRVSQQSLDGSIAFLQSRYNTLSKHEALEFFYSARCVLLDADRLTSDNNHKMSCGTKSALRDAVKAMGIMWCDGMLKLVDALYSGLGSQVLSLMPGVGGELSRAAVDSISKLLSYQLSPPLVSLPQLFSTLSDHAEATLVAEKTNFLNCRSFLEDKVKELLRNDENTEKFDLHSICGFAKHALMMRKFYHLNFWVTKRCDNNVKDRSVRILFFAEIWVCPSKEHESSFCELPTGVTGRCFSCEMAQNKILHPINEIYEGLQEAGFVDFLNCIWSKAKDPKKNMATDYFYFNDRTDVTLAKRLGEMTEPESEIRC